MRGRLVDKSRLFRGATVGDALRMAIDLERERIVPLRDVPGLSIIPRRRNGASLHLATLYRWAQRGRGGVCLETALIGGQRVTSVEAVLRFLRATDRPLAPERSVAPRSPAERRRAHARAERDLEAEGVR